MRVQGSRLEEGALVKASAADLVGGVPSTCSRVRDSRFEVQGSKFKIQGAGYQATKPFRHPSRSPDPFVSPWVPCTWSRIRFWVENTRPTNPCLGVTLPNPRRDAVSRHQTRVKTRGWKGDAGSLKDWKGDAGLVAWYPSSPRASRIAST